MTNKATMSLATLSLLLLALPSALAHPQSFAPSASTQAAALAALTGFESSGLRPSSFVRPSKLTTGGGACFSSLLPASRWRSVRLLC